MADVSKDQLFFFFAFFIQEREAITFRSASDNAAHERSGKAAYGARGKADRAAGEVVGTPDPALFGLVGQSLEQVGYHRSDAQAITAQLTGYPCEESDLTSRTGLLVQLRARARLGACQSYSSQSYAWVYLDGFLSQSTAAFCRCARRSGHSDEPARYAW